MYYLALILICIWIIVLSRKLSLGFKAKWDLKNWIKEEQAMIDEVDAYSDRVCPKMSKAVLITVFIFKALIEISILIFAYIGACNL